MDESRPEIHTVGLPMRIGQATIVVPVTCLCRPDNEPMLVTYGQVSVCPHCKGGKYMIESVAYKFKQTTLMVLIAQVAV